MANKRATLLNFLRDTTLRRIRVADGYHNTVGTVKRGTREIDSISDEDYPAIFIAKTTEERKNLTGVDYKSAMTIFLVAYVKSSTGIDGMQGDLDLIIEDITNALEADRRLGGNADWLEVRRVLTDDGDNESNAACVVTVEVNYNGRGTTT